MREERKVPGFPEGFAWFNTDRPLRFGHELKGQVVLLDFWTYCCINCMHVLPDLAWLEKKYANQPVAVIGVHSNKFDNEGSAANVRTAILRYEIHHPVIVDEDMQIWRAYGVQAWPTLVLVDPTGSPTVSVSGEGHRETLDHAIERALTTARQRGTLAEAPLKLSREASVPSASGLAFPGKILADPMGKRLFIADTNHNRIVITGWPDEAGHATFQVIVGTGTEGATDGPSDRATFYHPQGLALHDKTLYVADTENHLIRAVNLPLKTVTTILGTGKQSYDRTGGKKGTEQGISSPWDLAVDGNTLYIAMAGTHQLWRMDLGTHVARAFAGSGRENIDDGPRQSASLAQPSGLALADGTLYFADSETSSIRAVDLNQGEVSTIIGHGLFEFGDVDGDHVTARFQHPLGVTRYGDKLLVADTYNHKIKLIDPQQRTAMTFLGTGQPSTGKPDGQLALYEPGGLDTAGNTLLIADTNNHRIVVVDLSTREWHELVIVGLGTKPTP
jgi:sugar lactone lactonase YvrE